MAGNQEKVTMKTIADEAGVTLTTVSRILNHKGGKYAQGTQQRIFEIADRLKYRPNALVRGMQTGKTGTAGVMVPVSDPFYARVVDGIHQVFIENNTIMLLSWNHQSLNDRKETLERSIIHQMIDRRVEGILLRPSSEDFERSYFEEIWERDIPLILIDRKISRIDTNFVGTDDFLGGETAARHLIELGHRNMLFVGASQTTSTSRDREAGFRKVLSEAPNAFCREALPIDSKESWQELRHMLKTDNPPTAIFCYNDHLARQATGFILEAGLCIPNDVSLVGFGNMSTTGQAINLTTFEQHPREIGVAAAQMYLDRLNGDQPNEIQQKIIKPDLIVRDSAIALSV